MTKTMALELAKDNIRVNLVLWSDRYRYEYYSDNKTELESVIR